MALSSADSSEEESLRKIPPEPPAGIRLSDEPALPEAEEPGSISIMAAGLSDSPSEIDSLGFEPYVQAIKEFLLSPHTYPPLTLSIEGPWGSGKSSFMRQLRDAISPPVTGPNGRKMKRRISENSPAIIEFNPWRHDKQEALWAAFALCFINQLSAQCSFHKRVSASIRLFRSRFDWIGGGFQAARAFFISITLIICAAAIPVLMYTKGNQWAIDVAGRLSEFHVPKAKVSDGKLLSPSPSPTPQNTSSEDNSIPPALTAIIHAGGWTGSITLFLYILYSIGRILGNPFEVKLRKHIRSPDYEGNTGFIDNFQKDFQKVLDAYLGKVSEKMTREQRNKMKTFVFIDDLDRCDLPKAAELMNAINLLISEDQRLIFIVGMDRQKVAAAVATKYKDLLPYLPAKTEPKSIALASNAGARSSSSTALKFGYGFLEKFIQLPLSVPAPNDLDRFLNELSAMRDTTEPVGQVGDNPLPSGGGVATPGQYGEAVQSSRQRRTEEERERFVLRLGRDSEFVRETTKWVGRTFEYNPRRLKQFINLFRLRLYIADLTGCFDRVADRVPELTPEQLAKLTAIFLRWPTFADDWFDDPSLLGRLQVVASAASKDGFKFDSDWFQEWELLELLKLNPASGADTRSGDALPKKYSLGEVRLESVLRVMPAREPGAQVTPEQRRARQNIEALASEYMALRADLPAGSERTGKMTSVFSRLRREHLPAQLKVAAIRKLFDGSDGNRLAAIAGISLESRPEFCDIVSSCISKPRSPFEQFHALNCATAMAARLNKNQEDELRQALSKAIGTSITDSDPSRWKPAKALMEELGGFASAA